eukprot:TCONS_00015470-protein
MKTFACISLCLLVFFTNKGNATKTPGQSLDDALTTLKSEVATLQNTDSDLIKKINKIEQDLKGLKLIHGPCAPCRSIPGDGKNCDCTEYRPRKDCLEFYKSGFKVNGFYKLAGPRFSSITGYCDQKTLGGGWTVVQRRMDGSVNFNKNWMDYRKGFGKLESEFWFGNDNIHDLTKSSVAPNKSSLMINMMMRGNKQPVYAEYSIFQIGDEASQFQLEVSKFSGNVSVHRLEGHNKMKFTTFDGDHDIHSGNCASSGRGGWWYYNCFSSNLNGQYNFGRGSNVDLYWDWTAKLQPEFVEMKIRRNTLSH